MDSAEIIRANGEESAKQQLENFYQNATYTSIDFVTQSGSDSVFVYTIHYTS